MNHRSPLLWKDVLGNTTHSFGSVLSLPLALLLILACKTPPAPSPRNPISSGPSQEKPNMSSSSEPSFVPTLALEPLAIRLPPSGTQVFRATINYPPGMRYRRQPVKWQVVEADGGEITLHGVYTAPPKVGTFHVEVQREDAPELKVRATVVVEDRK